jgi:hypothetical protein
VGGNAPSVACTSSSQFGCRSGVSFHTITGVDNNSLKVTYKSAASDVDAWADSALPAAFSCRNDINGANSGNTTLSDPVNIMANWQDFDDIGGTLAGVTGATFIYQKTTMTGYVCSANLNNHAGEANPYYQNFTSSSQFHSLPNGHPFVFNIVSGCDYPTMEDVMGQYQEPTMILGDTIYGGESMDGYGNIRNDMINNCVKNH